MSVLTALARAQAWQAGRAQPVATVRHVHVAPRPFVFVPLALAGEACAPLAAMAGDDPADPRLLVVAQPRNRTQRFAFAAELGRELLRYIGGFPAGGAGEEGAGAAADRGTAGQGAGEGGEGERAVPPDAPQVWLPNRAGIGFTRLLGRSTRFRRAEGEHAVDPVVPVLGRWLTFLAERSEHPGSCLMLAATEALALHWATGQSPAEDLNLASLIGWIDPPAWTDGREAARAAEDPLAWPPAGPATDPGFDNEVLARLIAACDRAEAGGGEAARAKAALGEALAGQLEPAWRLTWRAIGLLRALPEGGHVAGRWEADRRAFGWHAAHLRDGGPPQPRRDSAVAAARRLDSMERAAASLAVQRALDDPLVMAEHRLAGEALAGRVTAAEPDRVITGPSGRRVLRPLVTVRTHDPVSVEPGTVLAPPGRPNQHARVESVAPLGARGAGMAGASGASGASGAGAGAAGETEVVLELSGGMGQRLTPAPGSVPGVGDWVCYATLRDEYQPPAGFPEPEQTPWTHGGPPRPYEPTDEDAREAWS